MIRAEDLARYDLSRVVQPEEASFLKDVGDRAGARIAAFTPLTVAERFEAFEWMHFKPHGLFFPDNSTIAADIRRRVREVGEISEIDRRLVSYFRLQNETAEMESDGMPGRWTGQQAWARSDKRFRQVAVSRRGGKTKYAACEALATIKMRPRSRVWVAAGTLHSASRCFEMILEMVKDLDVKIIRQSNARDQMYLIIDGGGRIDGVSLDDRATEVGAAIDLAIVDEANEMSREAWLHTILPPLTDRNGKVLLISSYAGQENFFYARTQQQSDDWDLFEDVSWNVNFYAFPQGRRSSAIQAAERESAEDMTSFLEEYGNIPAGTRRAIYPQYRDAVHAGDYPYQPGKPVILAIDPSSGANEYAVAVLQDHGQETHVIDEYYRAGVLAEEVMAVLDDKPWRADVREGICDSAAPAEILRWRNRGYNIIAISKPLVADRIPVYRKLLRDPFRFYPIFQEIAAEVLEEWGEDTTYDLLPPARKNLVYMEVESKLAASQLTPPRIAQLKRCSRIFVNAVTCPNLMQEHKSYAYRRPPRSQNMIPETPRKWKDHLMDCVGYFAWRFKRFEMTALEDNVPYSYLRSQSHSDGGWDSEDDDGVVENKRLADAAEAAGLEIIPANATMGTWLSTMRGLHHVPVVGAPSQPPFSILQRGR